MAAIGQTSSNPISSAVGLRQALLLLFCLPFFAALDVSSIWDSNEAFYVQTPREMIERGDWLVPHFNGQPRLNKPPLSYWLVALLYKMFGVSVYLERLLMALLACASIWVVYRSGEMLFDSGTALWGAGIFATSFRFLILSRRLLIDVLMLFCVLAALYFFLRWVRQRNPASFLLFCSFLGLGFLAKGPVALLPAAIAAIYLLWTRRLHRLADAPWLAGGLLAAVIGSSWFLLLGAVHGWQPVADFLLHENLGRFSHLDFGPQRGPFYYLAVFFTEFAPWAFLFPAALYWLFRRRNGPGRETREAFRFLGLWIAVYFIVFSLSQNKQEYYILPLYPAAALWVAAYLRRGNPSRAARLPAAAAALAGALLIGALARIIHSESLILWVLPPVFLALAAVGLLIKRVPVALAAASLFYAAAFWIYLPVLEEYKPVRPLARTILQQVEGRPEQSYRAGYYRLTAPSLAFYLGHPILELYEPQEAVRHLNSGRTVYLILKANDYQTLSDSYPDLEMEIVQVRPKLYTTARNLSRIIGSGRNDDSHWTRPVYLVRSAQQKGE